MPRKNSVFSTNRVGVAAGSSARESGVTNVVKRNMHTHEQIYRLVKWLEANAKEFAEKKTLFVTAAKKATAELGFLVNDVQIISHAKIIGVLWKSNRTPASATSNKDRLERLEERVKVQEDNLTKTISYLEAFADRLDTLYTRLGEKPAPLILPGRESVSGPNGVRQK